MIFLKKSGFDLKRPSKQSKGVQLLEDEDHALKVGVARKKVKLDLIGI